MTLPEIRTAYLYSVFNPNHFDRTIKQTLLKARAIQQVEQFDALVFTGTSGCALGFILAAQLNVGALVIRKSTESSHYPEHNHNVEGYMSGQKYLFVDDTIASGATFLRVERTMLREMGKKPIGALLYADGNRDGKQFIANTFYSVWSTYDHSPIEGGAQQSFKFKDPNPFEDGVFRSTT